MQRRGFLKLTTVLTSPVSLGAVLSSCASSETPQALSAVGFPQGVASADPKADSVVLWTRAEPTDSQINTVFVQLEMARDEAFEQIVLRKTVGTSSDQDFTVQLLVTELEPDQIYFYRFRGNEKNVSPPGRTWTAVNAGSTVPISFVFVSCQERKHGFYGAYRRMLLEDTDSLRAQQIRFVLHLGDFIYETDESWQQPLDTQLEPIAGGLIDALGEARNLGRFPDGATSAGEVNHASSLADYRHLYKTYLKDPDLRAARARWPFVCVWDDHEFSDDCWQTEANYNDQGASSSTDEPSQQRKLAANQAWSEYIPMDYSTSSGADPELHRAQAFRYAEVENTPNDRPNSDNQAVLESLTIYRRLQFGQMLDLVLTDNRSYRSDHAVPEDISGNLSAFIHSRSPMPLALVNQMDAGRTANESQPETFLSVAGDVFLNPRRGSPPGSMLGERQKQWWKQVMGRSSARWKVWGNSVPLMRLRVDLSSMNELLPDIVISSDTWDGYRSERNELMTFLRDEHIGNVVSLSGDVHAELAGVIMDDYDDEQSVPVMTEVVTAAISSLSQFAAVERLSRRDKPSDMEAAIRSLIAYSEPSGRLIRNLDNTLLNGVDAGLTAAQGLDAQDPLAVPESDTNPHLRHVDTDAHGYGLVTVSHDDIHVTLVSVKTLSDDVLAAEVQARTQFRIPFVEPGGVVDITQL